MSRVITVGHCAECPRNERTWVDTDTYGDWCGLTAQPIDLIGETGFPAWCPLPESVEKEESK